MFSTIGKGDLKVKLPTCLDHKSMTVTLQGVYYAPCMAFTLISIFCLDHAGCSVLIKDNTCIICGAHPKWKFLGSAPRIHGLYHIEPSAVISPMSNHHTNTIDTPMGIDKLYKLGHLNL